MKLKLLQMISVNCLQNIKLIFIHKKQFTDTKHFLLSIGPIHLIKGDSHVSAFYSSYIYSVCLYMQHKTWEGCVEIPKQPQT